MEVVLMTFRELWTTVHGIIFGAMFLLGFGGALVALWALKPEWVSAPSAVAWAKRSALALWVFAASLWATVITGTWIVYPWYRAKPPEGTTDLADYPRFLLLDDPASTPWHAFGMEWKEHIAWIAPILLTAVAYTVARHGIRLAVQKDVRQAVMAFLLVAFLAAAVAGLFGALITRAAPVK